MFCQQESQVKGFVTHTQNGTYFRLCRKPQPENKVIAFQIRTVGEWYHTWTPDRNLVFGLLLIRPRTNEIEDLEMLWFKLSFLALCSSFTVVFDELVCESSHYELVENTKRPKHFQLSLFLLIYRHLSRCLLHCSAASSGRGRAKEQSSIQTD